VKRTGSKDAVDHGLRPMAQANRKSIEQLSRILAHAHQNDPAALVSLYRWFSALAGEPDGGMPHDRAAAARATAAVIEQMLYSEAADIDWDSPGQVARELFESLGEHGPAQSGAWGSGPKEPGIPGGHPQHTPRESAMR